jgi:hypothetical protein
MTVLSKDEIKQFAIGAGFTGDDVNIAVAVALAESGGDTLSHNTKPPDDSYGLWQINMYGSLGPDRRKQFGLPNNATLFDPARNAWCALQIKNGSGWKAWTTYTTGKYKQFLDNQSIVDKVKTGVGDVTGISSIADSINSFGKSLFNGIASITGILVALVLLVLGIVILMRNQPVVRKLTKSVGKGVL